MKNIGFGQAVSILANVGAILGIAFLAVEISQNNDLLQTQIEVIESQTRFNSNERRTEVTEELFRNPELIDAYLKFANGQSLSQREDLMLSAFVRRILDSWAWIHGEVQRGNMSPEIMGNWRRSFYSYNPGSIPAPLMSHYWEMHPDDVDVEFHQWMVENVVEPGPP